MGGGLVFLAVGFWALVARCCFSVAGTRILNSVFYILYSLKRKAWPFSEPCISNEIINNQ